MGQKFSSKPGASLKGAPLRLVAKTNHARKIFARMKYTNLLKQNKMY